MNPLIGGALVAFETGVLIYFLLLNTVYLLFALVGFFRLRSHRRRTGSGEMGALVRSVATPGGSIIAPAHNEEATVVESVRSLLQLNYPQFEVVLVNDGSKDRTLEMRFRLLACCAHRHRRRRSFPLSRSGACTVPPRFPI